MRRGRSPRPTGERPAARVQGTAATRVPWLHSGPAYFKLAPVAACRSGSAKPGTAAAAGKKDPQAASTPKGFGTPKASGKKD